MKEHALPALLYVHFLGKQEMNALPAAAGNHIKKL